MAEKTSFNAPKGAPPSIEWQGVDNLMVDRSYQRTAEASDSQTLIRRIALDWDWRLCAPLTVSRRVEPAGLFVIDGQHRLEAARLRGDIPHLPCIISTFGSVAEEAGCFVAVNSARRRVTPLDTFRAQLAAGDPRAVQISELIHGAGLSIAKHGNHIGWKAGQIASISGVRNSLGRHGAAITRQALEAVAFAWAGEVLQYAGRILAGLYPIMASPPQDFDRERFLQVLKGWKQTEWYAAMVRRQARYGETPETAMQHAMLDAFAAALKRGA